MKTVVYVFEGSKISKINVYENNVYIVYLLDTCTYTCFCCLFVRLLFTAFNYAYYWKDSVCWINYHLAYLLFIGKQYTYNIYII